MNKVKRLVNVLLLLILVCFLIVTSNKISNTFTLAEGEILYDIDEMLVPFWDGETSYSESVLAVENENGEIEPITLLYDIDEIISVKSASLLTEYTEGKDYSVQNGKLVINASGNIPRLTYSEFHPNTGTSGFESKNGGYVLWKEGAWFHSKQIVVTYRHFKGYSGYVPEGKGNLLPKFVTKLLNKQDVTILVYGDSISTGANSSGHPDINVAPYMPIYPLMFAKGIEKEYGVKVTLINESKGGMDSNWGLSNLRGGILNKYPSSEVDFDLIIVGFGMNDTRKDKESFALNVSRLASGFMRQYKNAEAILLATMLPNEEAVNFWGYQEDFYDGLVQYEKEGVVAVNVGGVHKGLLQRKSYADMTGNNVNHANDYLARVYAQTLLKTLEISDYGKKEEQSSNSSTTESQGSQIGNQVTSESSGTEGGCSGAINTVSTLFAVALAGVMLKKQKNV